MYKKLPALVNEATIRPHANDTARIGCVVIGRNEGARLAACLNSLVSADTPTVYVDSGSTDASVEVAQRHDALVVILPMDKPFTAARARNAGFRRLLDTYPDIAVVQFVDGDCRVAEGWTKIAQTFLIDHPDVAIVCGQRREINPHASIYNTMCDIEWSTPTGTVAECGGDFMIRANVFAKMNGFQEPLIAGEEPELCYRIRKHDWLIVKLDRDMTFHDANILRLTQWVRRVSRAGYAYAARAWLHAGDGLHYCLRENLRIVIWTCGIPATIIAATTLVPIHYALSILLLYPLQIVRTFVSAQRHIRPRKLALTYSAFQQIGKFFEFYGQLQFVARRINRSAEKLIEYK